MEQIEQYNKSIAEAKDRFESIERPMPGVKDFRWIFLYTLILTSIYQVISVLLGTMTFRNFGHTLLVMIGNTLFTVFVVLCVEYIFYNKVRNES